MAHLHNIVAHHDGPLMLANLKGVYRMNHDHNYKQAFPSKLDTPEIRATFDLWLSYQASKGWTRAQLEIDAILMLWANQDPTTFREALLTSIGNGWKNLYQPPVRAPIASPRGANEPKRHTLNIKNPGIGKVLKFQVK